jgi:hypothetical protein
LNTLEAELPTSVFGNTMMTVLSGEKYTLDEIAQMPLETLTQDLNQLSHGRFGEPEEVAKALKKAIRSSYRLNKTVADSVDQILAMYIREIRMFQKQLKELDKSIAALCAVIDGAKSLNSMPASARCTQQVCWPRSAKLNVFRMKPVWPVMLVCPGAEANQAAVSGN